MVLQKLAVAAGVSETELAAAIRAVMDPESVVIAVQARVQATLEETVKFVASETKEIIDAARTVNDRIAAAELKVAEVDGLKALITEYSGRLAELEVAVFDDGADDDKATEGNAAA